MKISSLLLLITSMLLVTTSFVCINNSVNDNHKTTTKISTKNEIDNIYKKEIKILHTKADEIRAYNANNKFNNEVCFLVDMNLNSGLKRFYVYDLKEDEILYSGLMAHGSCNENYLKDAKFSNKPGCGCSSLGKYSVGAKYVGKYGTAYKLHGLDSSNSNAYKRNIVLHSYYCVPNEETYPYPICNSLGCPMVSKQFFDYLIEGIDDSEKPVLLWIFQ